MGVELALAVELPMETDDVELRNGALVELEMGVELALALELPMETDDVGAAVG
jgi:hypothetical protein